MTLLETILEEDEEHQERLISAMMFETQNKKNDSSEKNKAIAIALVLVLTLYLILPPINFWMLIIYIACLARP
jgi:hypothetical protein